ncbi:MAG TPA: substrate-binding domain-containing protein [Thermomicrobiales bacterium]|jgi:DNA-binding transcriptional LysR family regulator|nr:substrate-binding domain-containing protein [Thermomicrobiales bacterium]
MALLPHAERLIATIADGRRAVADLDGRVSGQVVITLVGTLASTTLPARLRDFRERYPEATLRLRTARSDEVSELVRQGAADIGLRYFPDPSAGLVSRVIGDEPLVVVTAPGTDLAGGVGRSTSLCSRVGRG